MSINPAVNGIQKLNKQHEVYIMQDKEITDILIHALNNSDEGFSTFKKIHAAHPWIICRTAYDSNTLKIIKNRLNDKCKQLNDWFYKIYYHTLKYLIISSFNASPFPNNEYHLCFYVDYPIWYRLDGKNL